MKIFEVLEAKKKHHSVDDHDEAPAEDPEKDKTPHIMMQLLKAVDVGGDYSIKFQDGDETKLPLSVIAKFLKKYMVAKPQEKEVLQSLASQSMDGFKTALLRNIPEPVQHKIKGDRYMSHFSGDFDDK